MAKGKKGTKYKCEDCGVVVVVDEPCGCKPCDLMCCSVAMVETKPKKTAEKKKKRKK